MTINDRIKLVRGKMSQREFGERIGATRNQVAFAEGNGHTVTGLFIASVSGNFGVRTEWLLTGQGDMYVQKNGEPQKSPRELAEQYLLEKFRALPPELQEDVVNFCSLFVDERKRNFKKRLDSHTATDCQDGA